MNAGAGSFPTSSPLGLLECSRSASKRRWRGKVDSDPGCARLHACGYFWEVQPRRGIGTRSSSPFLTSDVVKLPHPPRSRDSLGCVPLHGNVCAGKGGAKKHTAPRNPLSAHSSAALCLLLLLPASFIDT